MKPKVSLKYVREINSSIILDILKENAPLSKYDISKATCLSAPAVTNIVNDLLEVGFIKEVGFGESIGGRPPMLLDLNLEGGFVIGVDIGNDDIVSIITDFLGNIIARSVTPMDTSEDQFVIFNKIITTISDSINKSGKDRSLFLGMGIGIAGDIDSNKGIIKYASRLKWKNVPLKSIMENSFHIPTYIEENVRLLTFAENWYGAGKNFENIVCIRVGEDIGAGIILNGKLFNGSSEKAGVNINHMVIEPEGRECYCGKRGCLHTLISSSAIVSRHLELMKKYNGNNVNQNSKKENEISVKEISEAAKAGDPIAKKTMEETGRYLAIAISNIATCIDPEMVIIGGGVALSGSLLLDPVKSYFDKCNGLNTRSFELALSMLGYEAYSIGAATIVLHRIYSSPKKFIPIR